MMSAGRLSAFQPGYRQSRQTTRPGPSSSVMLGALLTTTVHLYMQKRGRTMLFALPIGALIAVIDELIQLFPAGRSCEVRDMVIDFSGILFATLIVTLIISFLEKRTPKKQLKEG